ncbi:hypothetical protein LPJ66_004857 [Kickxella alabastrina]|uniref:Uncharacterized protein n=1 Tax=Kickxella alabastrina TaxID=61397 RepID=A0ACC1IGB6_9FUNG|nr:hypothetical protein LPJ66_004857 [Kickxella alabastrina]
MPSSSFFDATLAQLSQLSALRACNPDTKAPEGTQYPPASYDFKMPSIQPAAASARVREDNLSLNFRTLKAPVSKFTLETPSIRTVSQVKKHLSRLSNIPANSMRLVLNGKGLVDSKLIGDYTIQDSSVIQIISKPAGVGSGDSLVGTEEVESNPLSSALKQQAETESGDTVDVDMEHQQEPTADAPIDNDTEQAISQSTKEQLKQVDSPFRIALRELVYSKFDSSQAAAVDRALEEFLSKL